MTYEENVLNFLNTFKGKTQEESSLLLKSFVFDERLVQNLLNVIECNHASDASDLICEMLFVLYTAKDNKYIPLCLQFVPAVIWAYYSLTSRLLKWGFSKVEILLLSIYNNCVGNSSDVTQCKTFVMPSTGKPSIYHEPLVGGASILTDSNLSQLEKLEKSIVIRKPTKLLDRIPASFRLSVIKITLGKYREYLSCYPKSSLECYCRMVMRLSMSGYSYALDKYNFIKEDALLQYPKVTINGEVTRELVATLCFIAHNGCASISLAALELLQKKSSLSVCPTSILVTSAAHNLLKLSSNKSSFEHIKPLDPHYSDFRGVMTLDSIQKVKKESLAQRPQNPFDFISPRLADTTSPTVGNMSNLIGRCLIETALTPITAPITAPIEGRIFSIEKSIPDESTEVEAGADTKDVSFTVESDGEGNTNIPPIELKDISGPAPKIFVDTHDIDDACSEVVPLIKSSLTSDDSNISGVSTETKDPGKENDVFDTSL